MILSITILIIIIFQLVVAIIFLIITVICFVVLRHHYHHHQFQTHAAAFGVVLSDNRSSNFDRYVQNVELYQSVVALLIVKNKICTVCWKLANVQLTILSVPNNRTIWNWIIQMHFQIVQIKVCYSILNIKEDK